MRLFLIVVIAILLCVIAGLFVFCLYTTSQSSGQALLNKIQFSRVVSTFGNGIPPTTTPPISEGGQLWTASNSVLAQASSLGTFLALAEWIRVTSADPIPSPDLPMFFTLPQPVTSVKTYLVASLGVLTAPNNNLKGVLLTPTHMALEFAHDEQGTGVFFTGNDVLDTIPQEIGIIIIYSTD